MLKLKSSIVYLRENNFVLTNLHNHSLSSGGDGWIIYCLLFAVTEKYKKQTKNNTQNQRRFGRGHDASRPPFSCREECRTL